MDPLILYVLLAVCGLLLFATIAAIQKPHTRRCPGCEEDVAINARACRGCGYAFT